MTATSRKNATETAGHAPRTGTKGIFDEAILNEWLLSDPAPGTYNEFRKGYTNLHQGTNNQYRRVQRHGSTP